MKSEKKRNLFICILSIVILFFIFDNIDNIDTIVTPTRSVTDVIPNTMPSVSFIESAVTHGIIFKHESHSGKLTSLLDTYGSGVCVLDLNNDGFQDLFIVGGQGVTRRYGKAHWWKKDKGSKIFINIKGKYFQDVTDKYLNTEAIGGFGCAITDLNGDNFPDIIYGTMGAINLLISEGGISFKFQSIPLSPKTLPMSLAIGDWNSDGLQDIFVATLIHFNNDIKVGNQQYGYQSQSQFTPKNFPGQSNLILSRLPQSDETINFKHIIIPNFERSLAMLPMSLLNSLSKEPKSIFNANAFGSNSSVIYANKITPEHENSALLLLAKIRSPLVQASTISVANKPAILLTNHNQGGHQLYFHHETNRLNDKSWPLGINTPLIAAVNTWATLVADFNNDGTEDIFGATGFATPNIDNLFKPQGSKNNILLQNSAGNFSTNKSSLVPSLHNSSRGAAYADFNNDGLIDIAVNNNNGFFSLYMNNSIENNWISIICEPILSCEHSHWKIQAPDNGNINQQSFSKAQPFLSSNQRRIHFSLPKNLVSMILHIILDDGTSVKFTTLKAKEIYRFNTQTKEIYPITSRPLKGKKQQRLPLIIEKAPALLARINSTENFQTREIINIAKKAITYKLDKTDNSTISTPEYLTLTSWLLSQALRVNDPDLKNKLMDEVIKLIGHSENRLYIPQLTNLIETLPEQTFCTLTRELHYWFWEEEIAPRSKQLLKAPLLFRTLNSTSSKIKTCGLYAISATEDTTIGSSLSSMLSDKNTANFVKASLIRTLGFLKNSKLLPDIYTFCSRQRDLIIKAECVISLFKLGIKKDVIQQKISFSNEEVKALIFHDDHIIIDSIFDSSRLNHASLNVNITDSLSTNYFMSPLPTHFELAHIIELSTANTDNKRQKALSNLSKYRTLPEIKNIIKKWQSLMPTKLDYFFHLKFSSNEMFINYFSNKKIIELLNNGKNYSYGYLVALARQCITREFMAIFCHKQFKTASLKNQQNVIDIGPYRTIELAYIFMSNQQLRKKIAAQKLYEISSQSLKDKKRELIFKVLRINQGYKFINSTRINNEWLSAFLKSTFDASEHLDSQWIEKQRSKLSILDNELANLLIGKIVY